MKIAYLLSSTIPLGGSTKAFTSLLSELMKRGINPIIIMPDKKGVFTKFQQMGIECIAINYRLNTFPHHRTIKEWILFLPRIAGRLLLKKKAVNKIANYLKDQHVDIIHTNVGVIDIGFRVTRILNIPHIYHIREYCDLDFGLNYFPNKRAFYRQLSCENSYSICITKDMQCHHQQAGKTTSRVIYDGICPQRKDFPRNGQKQFFLYAGRIEPAKGLDLLLEAYRSYVSSTHTPIPLWIAGSITQHIYYDLQVEYIERNNMQQFVVFLGERSDISDIMRQARALIIPSRFEGFGLCMPEAMFQGCLAIGHNTAGTKEQLDNGLELTGKEIALRYNTIEELTQLLKTVTERPSSDFDGYRLRAFDTVNQLYSSESNANSIYKFYNDIIQHKIH